MFFSHSLLKFRFCLGSLDSFVSNRLLEASCIDLGNGLSGGHASRVAGGPGGVPLFGQGYPSRTHQKGLNNIIIIYYYKFFVIFVGTSQGILVLVPLVFCFAFLDKLQKRLKETSSVWFFMASDFVHVQKIQRNLTSNLPLHILIWAPQASKRNACPGAHWPPPCA